MNFNWTFLSFLLLSIAGVLSRAITEVNNNDLFKRGYTLDVPNYRTFKYKRLSNDYDELTRIYFQDRHLYAVKCAYHRSKYGCEHYATLKIKLDYNAKCSYGDSKIERMVIIDRDGDSISELIDLNNLYPKILDKDAGRYINLYFKNGCHIKATYNYKNCEFNGSFIF